MIDCENETLLRKANLPAEKSFKWHTVKVQHDVVQKITSHKKKQIHLVAWGLHLCRNIISCCNSKDLQAGLYVVSCQSSLSLLQQNKQGQPRDDKSSLYLHVGY